MINEVLFPEGIRLSRFCKIANLRTYQVCEVLDRKKSPIECNPNVIITHKQFLLLVKSFFGDEDNFRKECKEGLEHMKKIKSEISRKILFDNFKKELPNNRILYPYFEPIFSPFFINNLQITTKFHIDYCRGGHDSDDTVFIYYESVAEKFKFRKILVDLTSYSARPFSIKREYKDEQEYYISQESVVNQELLSKLSVCKLKNLEFVDLKKIFDNICDFKTNIIDEKKYDIEIVALKEYLDLNLERTEEEIFIFIKGIVNYPTQNYFDIYEMMTIRRMIPSQYE